MESMETGAGAPSETYSGSQGVYIYRPADPGKAHGERPLKKRKVTQEPKPPSEDTCPFVPLLDGDESEQSIKLRYQTYEQLWSVQEAKIQGILDEVDAEVLENVSSFVKTVSPDM
jgi:origin recognition complex subunit 3